MGYKDLDASFPVPVIHFPGNVSKSGLQICILPDRTTQDSTSKLRESLIFHRLVEVDGARLYAGGGISNSLVDTVNKMRGEMDISVGTWNIPLLIPDTVVDSIISTDCYYQSRAKYQYYTVLSSTQVMMPHTYQTVRKTLASTPIKQGPGSYRSGSSALSILQTRSPRTSLSPSPFSSLLCTTSSLVKMSPSVFTPLVVQRTQVLTSHPLVLNRFLL